MSFRLDGRSFFLTYPKCNIARNVALEMLKLKLVGRTIDEFCIAEEKHEDGTPHLHCLIVLDKKKSIHNANFFDLGAFHGNYQTARNRVKVFDYVTKSDPNVLTNMSAKGLKIKSMTRAQVAERCMKGEKPEKIIDEYPQLLFGFKRFQDDLKAYEEAKVEYKHLPMCIPNEWGFFLNTFTKQKKRHWWIWSQQPNRGKTTWAKRMASEFGAHIKSCDFTYWNTTGREPLIILDDYNFAGLRYNALNQLCDGVFEARIFMGGVRRLEPKLVVILSNVSLRDLYPNMFHLLEARFIVKELV